ncbi:hypothetical protein ACHAW5_002837 [Stephanodiscus triporus]|uniref:Uncharacterized protein n=1 Tax=Stephanodiscus triporus TaxID=2934178 RepID=A0ABD3PSR6_9STRA
MQSSKTGTCIRAEAGPATGSAMSHTAVRLLAICWVMERKMVEKKLHECAKNWATEVSSPNGPVKKSAENWAKAAVQDSVVESIYYAWEGERHHSAERHPNVIIGAVTDGKANPLLMVFTLAPYDFASAGRTTPGWTEFFKELGNVSGNADLQWICRAAYDKYREIAETKQDENEAWRMRRKDVSEVLDSVPTLHAILEHRPMEEIIRRLMNDAAESMINKRVSRLSMLCDAIDEILKED